MRLNDYELELVIEAVKEQIAVYENDTEGLFTERLEALKSVLKKLKESQ